MEGRRKERNIAVWRRIVGSLCCGRMEGKKVGEEYSCMEKNSRFPV